MIIAKLLRRIRGFVRFTLRGGSPERLVTLAARDGISVRDLHSANGGVSAYTAASDYRRLRRHAKSCGCRMRLERKFGLPFLINKAKRRKGLVVGTVASVLLLLLLSRSVWITDVNGNSAVTDGEILYALRCQGIYAGALKSDIDLISAEQNALLALPELSWLAVNIRGARASVEVRERTAAPKLISLSEPCNLVASRGGTVKHLSVFSGEPAINEGDSVAAGDLIVSGLTDAGGVHAIAECVALVPVKTEFFSPYVSQVREYTGKTVKKKTLHLLNFDIPLSFFKKMSYNKYDTVTETDFLKLGGGSLPIGVTSTEYSEYVVSEKTVSPQEAADAAREGARAKAELEKRGAVTVSESETVTMLPDGALCTVELMLETDICSEKPILTE